MKLLGFGLAVMLGAGVSGQVQAQNILERINNGLERANRVLAGGSASAPAPAARSGGGILDAQPSDAQLMRMVQAMNAPGKSEEVEALYQEARELVSAILLITSCNFSSPSKQLERYKAPDGIYMPDAFFRVNKEMRHHSVSLCLDVQRVDAWKLEARNAFSFRVQYVSEQSGESNERYFTLTRQPDNVWMIFRAGFRPGM